MGKRKKGKVVVDVSGTPSSVGALGSSLAHALKAKGFSTSAQPAPKKPLAADTPQRLVEALLRACPKLQVHHERKGRGGKTVTMVGSFTPLSEEERARIATEMGKALGCGVFVEGEQIVLQGNQVARVRAWLN
ncbi:MAG: translation initiation factor [Deltaproteobacteria bacterium]|nr:translation initiation factor [Deltaproteobacteria bacterium]